MNWTKGTCAYSGLADPTSAHPIKKSHRRLLPSCYGRVALHLYIPASAPERDYNIMMPRIE